MIVVLKMDVAFNYMYIIWLSIGLNRANWPQVIKLWNSTKHCFTRTVELSFMVHFVVFQSAESIPESSVEQDKEKSKASGTSENSTGDNELCDTTSPADTCIGSSIENGSCPEKHLKSAEELNCDEMKNSDEIKYTKSESSLERDQNQGVS